MATPYIMPQGKGTLRGWPTKARSQEARQTPGLFHVTEEWLDTPIRHIPATAAKRHKAGQRTTVISQARSDPKPRR